MTLDPHAALPFAATVHPEARAARAITWDSRAAGPEVAFVALAGERGHGNDFVQQALDTGAPFVLTDLDVSRAVRTPDALTALVAWAQAERAKNPLVVGITGSVGKTTAKAYVTAALDALSMPVYNTIPAIACFLIENGARNRPLVVEMGIDHVGEMRRLMDLVRPDVGVITSIAPAHLQGLVDLPTIAREKGLALQATQGLVGSAAAAFYPDAERYDASEFVIDERGARLGDLFLPHAAQPQAEAAMLGLILAERFGIDEKDAVSRLQKVTVPSGRWQVEECGSIVLIDDSYNASPLAVTAALQSLSNFPGRKIAVLGSMLELGATEAALHAEVGEVARRHADISFGVGPFAQLLGERACSTVSEAKEALLAELRAGDVVLVKASRGISMTPPERDAAGVGLDTLVNAVRERWNKA